MTRHVRAFTAEFKIQSVRAGTCCQTIRPRGSRPVEVNDTILFHGWEERPYRSPWSWRLEVEVIYVYEVTFFKDCVKFRGMKNRLSWLSHNISHFARLDGFRNGAEMRDWFNGHYNLITGKDFQIIGWKPPIELTEV